jgi:hypothetical protein
METFHYIRLLIPDRWAAPFIRSRIWLDTSAKVEADFVSIPALIAMKQLANRPRDLDDIEHLRLIMEEKRRNEPGS